MNITSVTNNNWWALVLGGLASLVFGVAAVFWPGLTLVVLLYLFSAYVLISGIFNMMSGLGSASVVETWFLPVLLGAFQVGVGVYLLRHTAVKFNTFVILIGFTLIARGLIEAVSSYFNSAVDARTRALGYVTALIGLAVGIVILFTKKSSGVDFVWLLGLYGIVVGCMEMAALPTDRTRSVR